MDYFDYVTLLKSTLAVPDLNPECVPRIGVLLSKLLLNVGPDAPWYGFTNFASALANLTLLSNHPRVKPIGNLGSSGISCIRLPKCSSINRPQFKRVLAVVTTSTGDESAITDSLIAADKANNLSLKSTIACLLRNSPSFEAKNLPPVIILTNRPLLLSRAHVINKSSKECEE